MIRKVFKYQLKIQAEQEIELPLHSRVLSVKNQRNSIVLYTEVREDIKETKKIKVFLVCTGDKVPSDATLFLNTVLLNNGIYVLHVYLSGSYIGSDEVNHYHLWTIEDAKEGDVLAGKIDGDSYILIYKQIKDGWIETYGHYYNSVDRFCVPTQLFCREVNGTFRPATKEQKEFLFQKMRKAGYKWDEETKELKKAEQTIEIPFGAKDSELQEATYHIPEGYHAEINDNVVVIKKGEQKPTWSVEDKSKVQRICQYLNEAKKYYADITEVRECIDWLKSLEQRIG